MRRCHAISPGFSGHYRDLELSSLKWRDSAYNVILSVETDLYFFITFAASSQANPALLIQALL